MQLRFLGATGTVTGSRYLVSDERTRLLVDCGLFQGVKQLRRRNWKPLPLSVDELDAIVLSHAHIDHSGYLPVLTRSGFRGPVYCTTPTRDLCEVLLPDSGYLHEEDARYANRKGFSKHRPALPLYTEQDGRSACNAMRPVALGREVEVGGLGVTLHPAGHILGAASVRVRSKRTSVLISGDLGRTDDLIMRPPAEPSPADNVLIESTYGDRRHPDGDPVAGLGEILARTVERGGVVLIAAFAVGRAQAVLHSIAQLFESGAVRRVPVYLNSPMAIDVTGLYERHAAEHRLTPERCRASFGMAHLVRTPEESRALNTKSGPMIIVSASGMLTGGRILHHVKTFAPNPRNTLILPGYQAPGTRGGKLVAGADTIKIHGAEVPVRAEIVGLDAFSAHADSDDLLAWLGAMTPGPRRVFVVHGDQLASDALRARVEHELGLSARVPEHGETVDLAE